MITLVKISRFKRFAELSVGLEQLTVLTGTNGAGKTSVVHALLLAREAAQHASDSTVDLSQGDWLSLGDPVGLVNRQSKGDTFAVELTERNELEEDAAEAASHGWTFQAALDKGPEVRSLSANIIERPAHYTGLLSQPAPRVQYLCAERRGPRDTLGASAAAVSELWVGVHGEYTAQVLEVARTSQTSPARSADTTKQFGLLHQTELWMRRIVRPVEIRAQWFPSTRVTQLLFKEPGNQSDWTLPPNMGFGVSYVLPIVVAGLQAPKGGLLVVENPEAHLHPAGQSAMGAFLAQVAGDGVQVVVETHSDHLINGIRRAIAGQTVNLHAAQVAIQYFHDNVGQAGNVETIGVMASGQLSAWPAGFFDQTERDLGELARLSRRRK